MTVLVVVSPHLDDAVMSCGGLLAAASRRGDRAIVVTVFTEGEGHDVRRAEDREALGLLGVEAVHVGLADAPERLGLARSHRALVEEAVVSAGDRVVVERALASRLAGLGVAEGAPVLAPLGAGGHVDHLVVHEALRARPGVAFYEDRPYSLVPGEVRARLREADLALWSPITRQSPPGDLDLPPTSEALRAALAELPHLRAYLARGAEGDRSRAWMEARVLGSANGLPPPSRAVRPCVHSFDGDGAEQALRACLAYVSQRHVLAPSELESRRGRTERTFVASGSFF